MASEEIKRNRILEYSFKKFTSVGVQQVTMDDIAKGVGIGKGTLYKYFPSKEELLLNTIDFFTARMEKVVDDILFDQTISSVEKINLFVKTVAEKLSQINPVVLTYLERSMPESFEKIQQTRQRIILSNLTRLFEEGKRNRIIDTQTDVYLISQIMIGAISHIVSSQIIPTMNYSFDQLFTAITHTILKGCLTEEGRKLNLPI